MDGKSSMLDDATLGKLKVEDLAQTTFPDDLDRENFLNNINLLRDPEKQIIWYWYGAAKTGKTVMLNTLLHQLLHESPQTINSALAFIPDSDALSKIIAKCEEKIREKLQNILNDLNGEYTEIYCIHKHGTIYSFILTSNISSDPKLYDAYTCFPHQF